MFAFFFGSLFVLDQTSGIPDFRGKHGVWTLEEQGQPLPEYERCWDNAMPTLGHMALVGLVNSGVVHSIISQNVDGKMEKLFLPPLCYFNLTKITLLLTLSCSNTRRGITDLAQENAGPMVFAFCNLRQVLRLPPIFPIFALCLSTACCRGWWCSF